jgi:hypothetical protein
VGDVQVAQLIIFVVVIVALLLALEVGMRRRHGRG